MVDQLMSTLYLSTNLSMFSCFGEMICLGILNDFGPPPPRGFNGAFRGTRMRIQPAKSALSGFRGNPRISTRGMRIAKIFIP